MSKLTHRMTSEGDHFLGQKVIEVLRLGAANTLWYKLGKLMHTIQFIYMYIQTCTFLSLLLFTVVIIVFCCYY